MSQTFAFRAVDQLGAQLRGEVEADTEGAVVAQLRGRGLLPLEVRAKRASAEISLDRFARVRAGVVALLTRQLSTMIASGLALLRALNVLEGQTENPRLRATLVAVRQDVEAGSSLSDALERHPKVFDHLYVAMIRAGETGGFLESVLLRIADQLESQVRLRRQVRSAMVYPAVVVSIAVLVLGAMLAFIVPVFAKVFTDFGGELPALTRYTIGASDLLRERWYAVMAAVVLVVVGFRRWKASPSGRRAWDRIRLRAPLKIGPVVRKIALARWSRTLSSLVTAGVPMLEAIEVTGRTAGNTVVEQAMEGVQRSVHAGGTIAAALAQEPVFPPMVVNMVRVGEETGALDATLGKVADFYEDEVETAVKGLTSILEPVMIAAVGGIVGFMVLAMYLPMFHVYDTIQ